MSVEARGPWPEITVAEAIVSKRGRERRKLKTPDYQAVGALPIVDQGSELICGYTDDLGAAYPYDLPVIVFGDHTRALKFVEFPFAIGADGTQCLHPNDGFDPRFFYYALSSLDLRSEGYARHFKLLKERRIPVPPLDEQRRIAEVLRSADQSVASAAAVVEQARATRDALRSDLISAQLSLAATRNLGDVCEVTKLAGFEYTEHFNYSEGGDIVAVRGLNIKDGGLVLDDVQYVSRAVSEKLKRSSLRKNDLVLGYVGTIGEVAIIDQDNTYHLAPNVALLRCKAGILPRYVQHFLYSTVGRRQISKHTSKTAQHALSMGKIREFEIPVPSISEQERVCGIVDKTDECVRASIKAHFSAAELRRAVADELLSGRVRVPA